jgi:hypothetical protein
MEKTIFISFYDRFILHAENKPLFCSDMVEGHFSEHVLSIGNVRLGQLHLDRVRQDRSRIDWPPLLQGIQGFRTDAPLPREHFRIIMHWFEMKNSLVE